MKPQPHHVVAAAKAALPELVAEHDNPLPAVIFLIGVATAERGLDTKDAEDIRRKGEACTMFGWPLTTIATKPGPTISKVLEVRVRSRQATKLAREMPFLCAPPQLVSHTVTILAGSL